MIYKKTSLNSSRIKRGFQYPRAIKAKDTPWDADLTGSAACTVDANIYVLFGFWVEKCKILFVLVCGWRICILSEFGLI
jgi:hypothetical protein